MKWFHQTYPPNSNNIHASGAGWYNDEEQHYTDHLENSYVSDGTLKIEAIKEDHTNYENGTSTFSYTSADEQ